jgi:uncharacterized protein (TIGR02117 family)
MLKPIVKLLKWISISLAFFAAFLIFYLFVSVIFSIIPIQKEKHKQADVLLFIISNGVHTDIVLPVKNLQTDWIAELGLSQAQNTENKLISFGWGNREFYLNVPEWGDLTPGIAFCAISGLSPTAIHCSFYKNLKENEHCRSLVISTEQYIRLCSFISGTFKRSEKGEVVQIPTPANYFCNDCFFEATGHYHLLNTCNTWTNRALKASGSKACLWTPFAKGILYHYPIINDRDSE